MSKIKLFFCAYYTSFEVFCCALEPFWDKFALLFFAKWSTKYKDILINLSHFLHKLIRVAAFHITPVTRLEHPHMFLSIINKCESYEPELCNNVRIEYILINAVANKISLKFRVINLFCMLFCSNPFGTMFN